MHLLQQILVAVFFLLHAESLIIPEELPSILSLIYSNIPPIRKGTDSRVGFGFRLGEHADFQVLVELGPQTNTRPLGNENPTKKRHVQRLNNAGILQLFQQPNKPTPEKVTNTDAGKWLANWQQSMKAKPNFLVVEEEPIEGVGEVKAADVIPDDTVEQTRIPEELAKSLERSKILLNLAGRKRNKTEETDLSDVSLE